MACDVIFDNKEDRDAYFEALKLEMIPPKKKKAKKQLIGNK